MISIIFLGHCALLIHCDATQSFAGEKNAHTNAYNGKNNEIQCSLAEGGVRVLFISIMEAVYRACCSKYVRVCKPSFLCFVRRRFISGGRSLLTLLLPDEITVDPPSRDLPSPRIVAIALSLPSHLETGQQCGWRRSIFDKSSTVNTVASHVCACLSVCVPVCACVCLSLSLCVCVPVCVLQY